MAKFYGAVGYGLAEEIAPGVYDNVITERNYYGDVDKDVAKWREGGKIHQEYTAANVISIIADPYAFEHYFAIRYVNWMGTLWTISEVVVQRPRLVLRLGGIYNGPKVTTPDDTGEDQGS